MVWQNRRRCCLEKPRKKYPAITEHIISFKEKATKRYDKGQYWWELRACDYYEEFEKDKIIIPAITKSANYTFAVCPFYSNDKTSIIPSKKYLLGLLNCKLLDFYLKNIASTKQNGYFEYKPVYVSQIPIIKLINSEKEKLEIKVTQILALKKQDPTADTSALESEIDQMVYELYGLTEEEIAIVEGS